MESLYVHTVRVHMVKGTHGGGYRRWRINIVEVIYARAVAYIWWSLVLVT